MMRMAASHYTPVSDKLIPTGEIASVAGTVFDLRCPTVLGSVLPKCPGGDNNGYDHNFVLANTEGDLNFVCRVEHPSSGDYLYGTPNLLFILELKGDGWNATQTSLEFSSTLATSSQLTTV